MQIMRTNYYNTKHTHIDGVVVIKRAAEHYDFLIVRFVCLKKKLNLKFKC